MTDTGVIRRASRIMHAIARAGSDGARLTEITDVTQLTRPTVHRILKDLIAVGLVTQMTDNSRYVLGNELVSLALSVPQPEWDLATMRGIAQSLADDVGDTVYVSTRQIDGVRYLIRAEGSYPVRALMVNEGEVKPFTSSYSGLALLSGLSAQTVDRALSAHLTDAPEGWWDDHPTEQEMRNQIGGVATRGFCGGPGLVIPGVSGVAAPVPSASGPPRFAVSISAVDSRLDDDRIAVLTPQLLATAHQLAAVTEDSIPQSLKESA